MSRAGDDVHDFYVVGGAMRPGSPSYVERPADAEVLRHVISGHMTYVLTTRQMGKSSLLARTLASLRARSTHTARVDLHLISATGKGLTADQWFFGVAHSIASQLRVEDGLTGWWGESRLMTSSQRFSTFLKTFLVDRLPGQIVVAIDEIDSTIGLPFADDFFAILRACYNARANDESWNRLTFMLLGAATPAQLIESPEITPFNIGSGVDLSDFTGEQAERLAAGFGADEPLRSALMRRVFYWTDGHPYLTQKVCDAIATAGDTVRSDAAVDTIVAQLFFEPTSRDGEPNLAFVSERILRDVHRRSALQLFLEVLRGTPVQDDPKDRVHAMLKLSGLVKTSDGTLRVRNRIYEHVFTTRWAWQAIVSDPATFYVAGGALAADAGSYVSRPSDRQLRAAAVHGRNVVLLSPRMMGKTSALMRFASAVSATSSAIVVVDLSAGGTDVRPADVVRAAVAREMSPKGGPSAVIPGTGLDDSLRTLFGANGKAVVIVDELDAARDRLGPLLDEIAACIETLPNVTWVLSAALSPLQWRMVATPPTLGQFEVVELTDFALEDAGGLAEPWDTNAATKQQLLARVFEWTGGHPYLTQRLCSLLLNEVDGAEDPELVDRIAVRTFLQDKSFHTEPNLQWPRAVVESSRERVAALRLYRRVRQGQHVGYEQASPVHDILMRAGLVRVGRNGRLEVRNRVYREVFTAEWAASLLPGRGYRPYAIGATAAAVAIGIWYGVAAVLATLNQNLAALDDPRSSAHRAREAYEALSWASWIDRDAHLASYWRGRAARADRDSAIVYQLRSLTIRDTEETRQAIVASIGDDYGSLLVTIRPDAAGGVFSPDGASVLTATGGFGPTYVRLWKASTGEPVTERLPYPGAIAQVAYSPDGTFFAVAGRASQCALWNRDGKERARLTTKGECRHLAISPDSRLVATADYSGSFNLWDSSGKLLRAFRIGSPLARGVQFSPDGALLLGMWDEGVMVWRTATGAPVTPVLLSGVTNNLLSGFNDGAFDPKGAWVVVTTGEGDLRFVDLTAPTRAHPRIRHEWRAIHVEVSPDGTLLATTGQDNTARVWSVASGEQRCAIGLNGDPLSIAFMDAGRRLLVGESDGRASIWSIDTCQQTQPAFQESRATDTTRAIDATPSPDETQVLTASLGGIVRLWRVTSDDARTRAQIASQPASALLDEWLRRLALRLDDDGDAVPRF